MATVGHGESEVTLDGVAYRLVISHAALAHAERAFGEKLPALFAALHDRDGPQSLAGAAMMYGALRTHHRAITIDDVFALAETHSDALGAALAEAMEGAFPAIKEAREGVADARPGNPTKAAGGTGMPAKKRGRKRA